MTGISCSGVSQPFFTKAFKNCWGDGYSHTLPSVFVLGIVDSVRAVGRSSVCPGAFSCVKKGMLFSGLSAAWSTGQPGEGGSLSEEQSDGRPETSGCCFPFPNAEWSTGHSFGFVIFFRRKKPY